MIISSHGYIKIYVWQSHHLADPNGYAYEHRIIAEDMIGRRLHSNEIVHHIDHDKQNNLKNNLKIVIGNAGHYLHHRKRHDLRKPNETNIILKCACGCDALFKKYDSQGRPRKYISGHNICKKPRNICACGCGEEVKTIGRKYRPNHWSKKHQNKLNDKLISCACGCNAMLMKYDKWGRERKYISGHNGRKFLNEKWAMVGKKLESN